MGRVIALANQKGGVAKTTTVASLGAALAENGQRVLLVDLDPQACLTFSLGIDPEDLDASVHHVLTKGMHPREAIIETDPESDCPVTAEPHGEPAVNPDERPSRAASCEGSGPVGCGSFA